MKWLFFLFIFICFQSTFSQNISGKWVGKVTQGPGGYSQLYDLELDLYQRKNIWGASYAYHGNSVKIRIGLSGYVDKDSIRLSESAGWIREDKVPWEWVACVKKFILAYRKDNNFEYLEGTWNGISKDDTTDICVPGKVILSRTIAGLDKFLYEHKDSLINTEPVITLNESLLNQDFSLHFLETEPKKVTEIIVYNPELQIQLIDYLKVDNDTVSVYLNRNILAKNIRISKRPALLNFRLDTRIELHELLLYAENLGEIPPNTSELIVIDGDRRYRIMIVSDKQKTAAVYLRYKRKKSR